MRYHKTGEVRDNETKDLEHRDKGVKEAEYFRDDVRKRDKFLRLQRLGAG